MAKELAARDGGDRGDIRLTDYLEGQNSASETLR